MSMFSWLKNNTLVIPPSFTIEGRVFVINPLAPYLPPNRDVAEYWYSTMDMEEDGCVFVICAMLSPKDIADNTRDEVQDLLYHKVDLCRLSMDNRVRQHVEDRDAYHSKYPIGWYFLDEETTT